MFPEEFTVDILSRLPAKSIGRFRCVSKPWNSLLNQRQFLRTHINRAKQIPRQQESLLLVSRNSHKNFYTSKLQTTQQPYDDEVITTSIANELNIRDHHYPLSKCNISGVVSCDGLILLTNRIEKKLLLVNPITQEIKELPYLPYANPLHELIYGLGYDSISDDYKIIAISYLIPYPYQEDDPHYNLDCSKMTFVDIYSVKNGTWKIIDTSPYYPFDSNNIVISNGYVHWKAFTDDSSVLLAFELGEETCSEVPLPSSSRDYCRFVDYRFVELGGCLSAYVGGWSIDRTTDVWIMREYGVEESWVKFTIITKADDPRSRFGPCLRPLCVLGTDQLVLAKYEHLSSGGKLVLCNMKDGTFIDIVLHGMPDEFDVGVRFTESFVSPHYRS